jgi:hypothetical protein
MSGTRNHKTTTPQQQHSVVHIQQLCLPIHRLISSHCTALHCLSYDSCPRRYAAAAVIYGEWKRPGSYEPLSVLAKTVVQAHQESSNRIAAQCR